MGTTAILLLLGVVLAVAVIAVTTVRSSAEHAVDDFLRADLGGRAYAVQSGDPAVAAALESLDGAGLVADDVGSVSSATRGVRLDVNIRMTEDSRIHLGVLVRGRWPQRSGEALLSDAAARAIGLRIGDRAVVSASGGDLDVTIAGLTVDPADTSTRTAVVLVPPGFDVVGTRWLIDAPFAAPALHQALAERRASVQSAAGLVEAAAQAQPEFVTAMRYLPWGAGLTVGVVVAAFAAMRARRWATDVDTLVAAGMAQAGAWRTVLDGVALALLAGLVLGVGLTLGLLSAFRVTVSSWFGQRWVITEIPWRVIGVLALFAVSLVLLERHLPRSVWHRVAALLRWATSRSHGGGRIAQIVFAVTAAVWASLTAAASSSAVEDFLGLLPLLAALLVFATPFALAPLLRVGLGPALRAICRDVTSGLAVIVAAAAVVALICGIWAAQRHGDASRGELASSPMQPAGSFLVDRMPDAAVLTLRRTYQAAKGRALVAWRLPDESRTNLRVTSPTLVRCLQRSGAGRLESLGESCWPQGATSCWVDWPPAWSLRTEAQWPASTVCNRAG